jgi:hypothetical protein
MQAQKRILSHRIAGSPVIGLAVVAEAGALVGTRRVGEGLANQSASDGAKLPRFVAKRAPTHVSGLIDAAVRWWRC